MLTWQKYDVEVDIWSAGCIFAEMLEGKPLFPGKDHVNQFSMYVPSDFSFPIGIPHFESHEMFQKYPLLKQFLNMSRNPLHILKWQC